MLIRKEFILNILTCIVTAENCSITSSRTSTFVPYLAAGYAGLNFDGKRIDSNDHGAFDYGVG